MRKKWARIWFEEGQNRKERAIGLNWRVGPSTFSTQCWSTRSTRELFGWFGWELVVLKRVNRENEKEHELGRNKAKDIKVHQNGHKLRKIVFVDSDKEDDPEFLPEDESHFLDKPQRNAEINRDLSKRTGLRNRNEYPMTNKIPTNESYALRNRQRSQEVSLAEEIMRKSQPSLRNREHESQIQPRIMHQNQRNGRVNEEIQNEHQHGGFEEDDEEEVLQRVLFESIKDN